MTVTDCRLLRGKMNAWQRADLQAPANSPTALGRFWTRQNPAPVAGLCRAADPLRGCLLKIRSRASLLLAALKPCEIQAQSRLIGNFFRKIAALHPLQCSRLKVPLSLYSRSQALLKVCAQLKPSSAKAPLSHQGTAPQRAKHR